MKKFFVCPVFAFLALCLNPVLSLAQDSEDDEVFELSPFSVDTKSRSAFRAGRALSGDRINTDLKDTASPVSTFNDLGTTISGIEDPLDPKVLEAKGVRIEFAIGFYDDAEKVRRQRLIEYLSTVREAVSENDDLLFEPGAMMIAEGDRKRGRSKRRSEYTSYVYFSISFDRTPAINPWEETMNVRQLIASLDLENEYTKVFFGDAYLLEKSPFEVLSLRALETIYSSPTDYVANLGGNLSTKLTDRLGRKYSTDTPRVPITLIKRADLVTIQFGLDVQHADETSRTKILRDSIETIRNRIAQTDSLEMSVGSILVQIGDTDSRHRALTGQAQFVVSFPVTPETDSRSEVYRIREIVRTSELDAAVSKIHYGDANLVIDDPNRYRTELLKAITEDLSALETSLGDSNVVEPEIQSTLVRMRQHSDNEVQLWINYDYKVTSKREIEAESLKLRREHEVALAASQKQPLHSCCQHCSQN